MAMSPDSNAVTAAAADGPGFLRRIFATPKALGMLPHAWLLFLGFFIMGMLNMSVRDPIFWACIGGMMVFIPVYYAAFRRCGRAIYPHIGIITLLGMLFTPVNFGATVFFNYAAYLCGQAMAPRRALIAVGLMCAWMLTASYALNLPIWYYLPGIIVSAGLVGISISERKQQLANSALSRSRQEVRRLAQMAERERIARDLHDVLGHTLSVITLKAELASKLVDTDPERAREEIAQVAATSREALASVRETVGNYRRVGLADEIETARHSLKRAGVSLLSRVDDLTLSPRHETLLALIVREATTNVIRHAGASQCELTLTRKDGEITLVISDNGQGFDGGEGQGMTGMRERLAVLGGTLQIAGYNGTSLTIRVPESLNS